MKSLLILPFTLSAFVFLLFGCSRPTKEIAEDTNPRFFEVKGYVVPKDSLIPPEIIPVETSQIKSYPFKISKATTADLKVRTTVKPVLLDIKEPKVIIPGKGGYALPDIIQVIDRPFIASPPLIVEAHDPVSKDVNPGNFLSYDIKQGLLQNHVNPMFEDHFGNLWIGYQNGVTKFDGKFFTHYTKKSGLSHDDILSIFEDSQGNMWFGTNGGGVTKFDGRYFTHYTIKEGLVCDAIYKIIEDQSGKIWFGSWSTGITIYDGKTFTNYSTKQGLPNSGLAVIEDSKGNIWISLTLFGFAKYNGSSFSIYSTSEGWNAKDVMNFMEDSQHNIWISTKRDGVIKYDGEKFNQYTSKEGLSSNTVITMMEDSEGNIWFGGYGISKFDGHEFQYSDTESGLPGASINSLMKDRFENIWIGTSSGLAKYSGNVLKNYTKKDGLPSEMVWTILTDSIDRTWFGTSNGLAYYENKSFKEVPLMDMFIGPMVLDHNQNLWFNLYGYGLASYDGKQFQVLSKGDGIEHLVSEAMFMDKNNILWIGTNGAGLLKYDGKIVKRYFKGISGISDPDVLTFQDDQFGRIWLGTYGGGITVVDGESYIHYKKTNGFVSDYISCIHEDTQGQIWIGTLGEGLCKCSMDENHLLKCIQITTDHGLANNYVQAILEDKDQNIVIGTQNGISIISTESVSKLQAYEAGNTQIDIHNLIKNLTYGEGFLGVGVNFGKSMHLAEDGTIWIGANDRLTNFNLNQYNRTADTTGPNIQLMDVRLFNEKINWSIFTNQEDTSKVLENGVQVHHTDFDSLSKWYGVPENLNLSYDNNYLTFNYIGITLYQPQKVKYQYMLEGNDKNWNSLTGNTEAHYGNLSHGSYLFKVKAVNGEGYWSKELQYPFTIRPPWWHTWWAYSLYALAIAVACWRVYQFQRVRIIRIHREKELQRELEHANEIQKAYTELKETQAQLIQREKMASLGELTAGIAHEIQNPLNFVNNFSEVNTELIAEMKEELQLGHKDEAISIANDISENEQKINHHGKRADAIVKGMLQHSRTSSGVKEPTDINALADEYLRLAYHGLRAKDKTFNATMKTDFDDTIGKIEIIPQDIGRVILNLITNAFYAVSTPKSPKGDLPYEPTVTIKTKSIKPPLGGLGAGKVEITVSDNGSGIPHSALDKIFQPFFTTKPTGQGTGLGLSLSYDIVKAHGGELKVETVEGEGSVFSIILPI